MNTVLVKMQNLKIQYCDKLTVTISKCNFKINKIKTVQNHTKSKAKCNRNVRFTGVIK